MRLKYLFFPSILIISFSILIGYIWPEMKTIKQLKAEVATNMSRLNDSKSSTENLQSLGADLEKNKDKVNFIMAYLPESKSEEKIIDSLNYFATSSGLSVLNMNLQKEVDSPVQDTEELVSATPLVSADLASSQLETGAPVAQAAPSVIDPAIKFARANVSVVGEYEKIQMYLEQIRKMSMYNKISEVTITEQKKEGAATPDAPTPTAGPVFLLADIAVDFAYSPMARANGVKANAFTKANFDFAPEEQLREFVGQKGSGSQGSLPQLEIGATGKDNPFLP